MKRKMRVAAVLVGFLSIHIAANGAIIWTGPDVTFSKSDFANPLLSQNQDRLTDLVWITRANTGGIFNINQETGYTKLLSPKGTAWASGSAANWQSLTFTNWETWAAHDPPAIVGRPAVMHLISEDIYLDVKFLSWTSGRASGGGGFSYVRSSVPEPASLALLGLCALGLLGRARRRQ